MLVMILENAPESLKGELSRWLIEPKSGVFLGNPSARVRDQLWNMAIQKSRKETTVTQIWSDNNPQGYKYRDHGGPKRKFIDFEGITLLLYKNT